MLKSILSIARVITASLVVTACDVASVPQQPERPQIPLKLASDRAFYESVAPEGWRMTDWNTDIANFSIPELGYNAAGTNAAISRTGFLERGAWMVRQEPFDMSDGIGAVERERDNIPDIEHFVVRYSDPIGSNTRKNTNIRSVSYTNEQYGIVCNGSNETILECFWGSQQLRFGLTFSYGNLRAVLPYVYQLNARSRHAE